MTFARRRARLAAGLAAAVVASVLAACGTPEDGTPKGEPSKASASSASGGAASDAPAQSGDPDHSVDPPGKLEGPQYGDDLLLVSQQTIPDDLLAKLTGIKVRNRPGIVAYDQFSYGQFSVENKVFNIAAVDPASYRRFTGSRSATWQEQWDRIAGGEIAVADRLQKQLPVDGKGFLTVGKHQIHVGAWSPATVDSVDVMVNKKWGETLGLRKDNALLVNTGTASPQVVRERIEKAVGAETFAIIALDIVAQTGIDPDAFATVVPVGSFGDAVGVFRYRPIGGGRIAPDPAWVEKYIVTDTVPILGRVTCNRYMMPQLKAALADVVKMGLAHEIHPEEYAGCYYPRFIAGSNTLSNHSFGLALDFNVPGNQRGTVGEMHRGVVAIFKKWGFAWGGDWAWTDPMHFELARIVKAGN
jgi:hypothetical protein